MQHRHLTMNHDLSPQIFQTQTPQGFPNFLLTRLGILKLLTLLLLRFDNIIQRINMIRFSINFLEQIVYFLLERLARTFGKGRILVVV